MAFLGVDFVDQALFVRDTAVEALGRQDAELGPRQIIALKQRAT